MKKCEFKIYKKLINEKIRNVDSALGYAFKYINSNKYSHI